MSDLPDVTDDMLNAGEESIRSWTADDGGSSFLPLNVLREAYRVMREREVPSLPTCATCRHARKESDRGSLRCERIMLRAPVANDPYAAWLEEGSLEGWPELRVNPDFGCTLHEGKADNPAQRVHGGTWSGNTAVGVRTGTFSITTIDELGTDAVLRSFTLDSDTP